MYYPRTGDLHYGDYSVCNNTWKPTKNDRNTFLVPFINRSEPDKQTQFHETSQTVVEVERRHCGNPWREGWDFVLNSM